ncbi:uncharacterized protein MONBRDRAFT_27511 [Monosiga brevicollis MX1]|uniref:N-acylglucosamine 2-epimerase n=1 Tax=Monosiga brevicollis TaxID=81824 RepID=A9V5H2_MONBE|nr:uncharacterized protein MONBRDRAFT_27511 [Monosiga brevicollis MX1]EDQ87283.1 predicted protein [Monosiga brevicollis MX1]|eukprot:XP_001747896.1 hypothetical protein [Monosiga brevicollis MX1]
MFHYYRDDWTVYDREHRHLVSSTRFVWQYAEQARRRAGTEQGDQSRALALHAWAYVRDRHYDPEARLYHWSLRQHKPDGEPFFMYGQAFVLLALSALVRMGDVPEAQSRTEQLWDTLEARFWEPAHNAYADELPVDADTPVPYRGQNANMHACEACLALHAATGQDRYLQRARALAETFCFRLPRDKGIWEHYNEQWHPDLDFNKDAKDNIFRPWGYQTGHQVEWAKLLLILHEALPRPDYVDKAKALFDFAESYGRDRRHGGWIYGYDLDGLPCDSDKYFWVQAETFAAAYRLYAVTGQSFLQKT